MIEGLVLGQYDHSSATVTQGNSATPTTDALRNESYDFHRFGGGGAVGVRVASKHPHVRFTGSFMLGAVAMGNIYNQTSTAADSSGLTAKNTSSTTTYGAPLLMMDAGVLLGAAGGVKFHLSGLFMAQFVGSAVQAPPLNSDGKPTNLGNNGTVNEGYFRRRGSRWPRRTQTLHPARYSGLDFGL